MYTRIKEFLLVPAVLATVLVALAAVSIYGYVRIASLTRDVQDLAEHVGSLTTSQQDLALELRRTQRIFGERIDLNQSVLESKVGSISSTVGTLQQLANTDPQLLEKYSKVFFLNENYTPVSLTQIPSQYLNNTEKKEQLLTSVWPFLQNLLDEAKHDGIDLSIASAYRSFSEQKSLKGAYTVTYGSGANQFSADQGYSEHQLGTTVDFITPSMNGALVDSFDATPAYAWLAGNAYKYGFELSYPKNNSYYSYEPWHWRFVGVALATYLHNNHKNFYDLDQRNIDTYLANIFQQ